MRTIALLPLALTTLLAACGGTISTGDEGGGGEGSGGEGGGGSAIVGTGGAEATTSAGETATSTTTGSGTLEPGFCDDACSTFAEGGCFTAEACASYCAQQHTGWTSAVGDAFSTCVATEPLCFETVENCVLRTMYPEGTSSEIVISGTGFEAFEGKTVRLASDVSGLPAFDGVTTVYDGAFEFVWSGTFDYLSQDGLLFLLHLDANDDGQCSVPADRTHAAYAVWNVDFVAPKFVAELTPALNDAAFVCDALP